MRFTRQPLTTLVLAGLIVLAALSRMLPHPPNFSPVEAVALFGAERVLFGSDQPVSGIDATGVASAAWIDLVRDAVPAAWTQISRESARRFYALD